MKKAILLIILFSTFSGQAQLFEKFKEKVTQKTNQKVDEKLDQAAQKTVDTPEEIAKKKKAEKENSNKPKSETTSTTKTETKTESSRGTLDYSKFDFVPGDKVLFEDDFANESTDEIPSHWIVTNGRVEMVKINGEMAMGFLDASPSAYPRVVTGKKIVTDRFTLEFDFLWRHNTKEYFQAIIDGNTAYDKVQVQFANSKEFDQVQNILGDFAKSLDIYSDGRVEFSTFSGSYKMGKIVSGTNDAHEDLCDKWVHVSIAVNEKSLKVYLNSQRILNAPIQSGKVQAFELLGSGSTYEMGAQVFVKNVRVAAGGADPYKTLIASGKFIARGINFDVNKATIKPESMGTLNTIVQMMKEHAELKFEIGGHTDSDGNDASNLKLSQDRADAVKAKLISMGIDAGRFSSKGYGETKPVGSNTTFEGKAENRRVEFVIIK
jgi:outer membrane protein OmpA-like peptidoglycan-associated protein